MPTASHVEDQILDFLRRRRRVMFLELADVLSGCSWKVLLSALSRLHARHLIDLFPHKWDMEILLRENMPGMSQGLA
ncbi:MAG: hypothetical protein EPO61_15295 [Nitrospirae bacterium]|nr:MAG: hypothetical protein EPO61_15295 [Nitrospirota bacterium]